MKKIMTIFAFMAIYGLVYSQQPGDKSIMKEPKPGYYQNVIMKDVRAVDDSQQPARHEKVFQADLTGKEFPNKVALYQKEWYLPPVSQGNSNTCWCFSTTSFLESEVHRLTGQEIKTFGNVHSILGIC